MSKQKIAHHLSFRDVIRVLKLIDAAPFRELQLELEGLKLRVVQDREPRAPTEQPAIKAPAFEPARGALREPREQVAAAAPAVTSAVTSVEGKPVLAPLAGIFYRSPFPGEPPYVEVGAAVKEGDVVGILEVMKLMNLVTAPCSGVVARICVQNEEMVEYGQVLAVIDPERVK